MAGLSEAWNEQKYRLQWKHGFQIPFEEIGWDNETSLLWQMWLKQGEIQFYFVPQLRYHLPSNQTTSE